MGDAEAYLSARGYRSIMGVDEVGRGPLAGNVVAAAVVLPMPLPHELRGLDDSKKLSEQKRNDLFAVIIDTCVAYGVGEVSPQEIDRINIFQATLKAMRMAVENGLQRNRLKTDILLIDGRHTLPKLDRVQAALVKGDSRSYAIAAASIIAKVTRDQQMRIAHNEFPHYGFKQHKGYGTKAHRLALTTHGPCPIHRRSFKWQRVES